MKKIFYVVTSVSLIPIIFTYFAWGSTKELFYMIILIAFSFGLILITIDSLTPVAWGTMFLGALSSLILLSDLIGLWFENIGGDRNVAYMFTFQWIILNYTLILIYRGIRSNISKKVSE